MALLICAATPAEMSALAPYLFPDGKNLVEMQPVTRDLRGDKAVFLVTGVGPLNAALAIGLCLGREGEKISCVLYAGLSGAYDLEKNPLCSTWGISEEIWPEYGLNDGINVTARAFSHPLWARTDGEYVYDRISLSPFSEIVPHGGKIPDWPCCQSLTVAGVSASFNRRETLTNNYHAALENMEGFAAAYAAARANPLCGNPGGFK